MSTSFATAPVNLDNLREITGGDTEIEQELFRIFLESSAECLTALAVNCGADQTEAWRKQAHALKGISYNLGAQALGDLCKMAQDEPTMSAPDKQALLTAIRQEYAQVAKFLEILLPAKVG
jgi:HPt (histidine-containing phosphotransfer) domain-containing protein